MMEDFTASIMSARAYDLALDDERVAVTLGRRPAANFSRSFYFEPSAFMVMSSAGAEHLINVDTWRPHERKEGPSIGASEPVNRLRAEDAGEGARGFGSPTRPMASPPVQVIEKANFTMDPGRVPVVGTASKREPRADKICEKGEIQSSAAFSVMASSPS